MVLVFPYKKMGSKSGVCTEIITENLCWERSKAGNTSHHWGSHHTNLLRREQRLMGKPDKNKNGSGNWYFQCPYQIPDKPELFPPLQEELGLGRGRQEALVVWWAPMPTGQSKILSSDPTNTVTERTLHDLLLRTHLIWKTQDSLKTVPQHL